MASIENGRLLFTLRIDCLNASILSVSVRLPRRSAQLTVKKYVPPAIFGRRYSIICCPSAYRFLDRCGSCLTASYGSDIQCDSLLQDW